MKTSELMALLRKRYAADQGWVLVTEVANGTGSSASRHADAVALQTWPSRGIELDGFELKVSRGDLLRELAEPKKADAVGRFCARWWLVVSDAALVDGVALPPAWGVLAPKRGVLHAFTKPTERKPDEWPRTFLAALVRRAHEERPAADEARAALGAATKEAMDRYEAQRTRDGARDAEELRYAKERLDAFDQGYGPGLHPMRYATADRARAFGAAARLGSNGSDQQITSIERVASDLERIAGEVRRVVEAHRTRTAEAVASDAAPVAAPEVAP